MLSFCLTQSNNHLFLDYFHQLFSCRQRTPFFEKLIAYVICFLAVNVDGPFSALFLRHAMSHCWFVGIADSFSSYESYYMSGTSDAEYSSDSGSMEAFGPYHYDVSHIDWSSFSLYL